VLISTEEALDGGGQDSHQLVEEFMLLVRESYAHAQTPLNPVLTAFSMGMEGKPAGWGEACRGRRRRRAAAGARPAAGSQAAGLVPALRGARLRAGRGRAARRQQLPDARRRDPEGGASRRTPFWPVRAATDSSAKARAQLQRLLEQPADGAAERHTAARVLLLQLQRCNVPSQYICTAGVPEADWCAPVPTLARRARTVRMPRAC
jgi:hypothetical protein